MDLQLQAKQVKQKPYGSVRKMGATTAISSRDRRRQGIIDVARRIFLEEGYGAASMSSIAAAVGGSKATLYAYFRSKSELFSAVMDDMAEAMGADKILRADDEPDTRQALTWIAHNLLTLICRPEVVAIQRLVTGEAGRFPELGEAFFKGGPRTKIEWLTALLGKMMDDGRLRRDDPLRAAEMFFAMCRFRVHHYLMWAWPKPRRRKRSPKMSPVRCRPSSTPMTRSCRR